MATPNYQELLDSLLGRFTEIVRERSNLNAEQEKIQQLLYATVNMLPDDERDTILGKWNAILQKQLTREASLIDSIRKVLQDADRQWLTVAEVRNRLVTAGFDFSGYMSNPLASVSSTLTRIKDKKEAACNTVEGVKVYRWKTKRAAKGELPATVTKSFTLGIDTGGKKE